MRLTLRTLLAYMDDILDPEDAAELRRKIEESDVAKALMARIREVLRRRDVGVAEVSGLRGGLDPNTVAEYIDNTLPGDQVADFEKVCLESDMTLAEVAACHQILAMVLGEPAEVDPRTRERIYRLPKQLSGSEKPVEQIANELVENVGVAAAPQVKAEGTPRPAQPEFVSTVRESRHFRTWLLVVLIVGLIGALAVGALAIYRNWRPQPPAGTEVAQGGIQVPAQEPAGGEPQAPAEAAPGEALAESPAEVGPPPGDKEPGTQAAAQPGEGQKAESIQPPAGGQLAPEKAISETPLPPAPAAAVQAPAAPIPQPGQPGALPGQRAGPPPQGLPPLTEGGPAPAPDMTQPPGPVPEGEQPALPPAANNLAAATPELQGPPGGAAPSQPAAPNQPTAVPGPEAPPLPPEPIGRILDDTRIPPLLFQVDPNGRIYRRINLSDQVRTGDSFYVPPLYRVKLHLAESLEVLCVGPVFWGLDALDAQGQLTVRVDYGQLVFTAKLSEGAGFRLKSGTVTGLIELGDQHSEIALSVGRDVHCAGDPETQPVPWVTDLYTLGGVARWYDSEHARPVVLRAPVQVRLSEAELETSYMPDQPAWVNPPVTTGTILQERAMGQIHDALRDPEKDPYLVLREQAQVMRREVATLARQVLAYAGQPDLLWQVLDDVERRPGWTEAEETLRNLVRISPQLAAAVRASAEQVLGGNGPVAYALLWKYSGPSLTKAEAEQLISLLEHPNLAIRILASSSLRRVTDMTLGYEPNASTNERSRAVQTWRQRLTKGPIRGISDSSADKL